MPTVATKIPRVMSLPDLGDHSTIVSRTKDFHTAGDSTTISSSRLVTASGGGRKLDAEFSISDSLTVSHDSISSCHPNKLAKELKLPEHLQLEAVIGQGAMGTVFRAWDRKIHRRVALKISHGRANTRSMKRFQREMQATARVSHPAIVPIYEHFGSESHACYTMQLLDGNTFEELIEAGKPSIPGESFCALLSPEALAQKFATLAEGLDAAHMAGVIHRDIKPSNLMLDQADRPWIIDFGLAKLSNQAELTHSGEIVGSLRYMSPEQRRGVTNLSPATDIFSLGVTLHECLTGNAVCPRLKAHELETSGIPNNLLRILAKATALNPRERYGTAYQFAMDLRQFADQQTPLFANAPEYSLSKTLQPSQLTQSLSRRLVAWTDYLSQLLSYE